MTVSEEKLTPMVHAAQNRCFGCGQANRAGLRLEFFRAADASVVCLATVADRFEGPRGYLHGGIIATLLDETMSKAVRARGLAAMTRQIEIDYRRPVPSGAPLRIESRILRSEGGRHWTEAKILDAKEHTLASAKGLFVEVHSRRGTMGQPEGCPVTA
jgi:uncharacterized protein (TIGR00369 family)